MSPEQTAADRQRTPAEWITFGVSLIVLAVFVGLVARELTSGDDAPAPVASQFGPAREVDGTFFVPVEVVNEGDRTAADVQVSAELTVDGEVTSGDQVVNFLGGGERRQLTFAFSQDPSSGELVVRVTGYADP